MAIKLPSEEDLGPGPKLLSGRPIATIDYGPLGEGQMAIGKAISHVGQDMASVAHVLGVQQQKNKAEDDYTAGLAAEADFKVNKVKLDTLASDLNDPDKLEEHKPRYQAALEAAAQKIPDPKQREQFLLRNAPSVAGSQGVLDSKISKIGLDRELAQVDTDLYEMKEAALKNPDPAKADEAIQAANLKLDALAQQGKIDPVKAVTMKRAWAQDYSERFLTTKYTPEEQVGILKGTVNVDDKNAVLDRIGGVESGGRDNAANPLSSAKGRFQFIDSTWLRYVKQYRPDLAAGKTDASILGMRGDGALSREMAGKLLDNNAAALKDAGMPVTPGTLYLAHFLGVGDKTNAKGAIGFLAAARSNPATPVSDLVGPAAINANRSILAGKTVGQVISWADRKMGVDPTASKVAQYIPSDRRQALTDRAQKQVTQDEQQNALVTREEAATVTTLMKRDEQQVAANGTPIKDLTPERVEASHGPEVAADFANRREAAQTYYDTTKDFDRMPDDMIKQQVEALKPTEYEGTGKWNARQDYYEKAQQRAQELKDQRATDPAAAIANHPDVKAAEDDYKKLPPGHFSDFQKVVQARLDAQARVGVAMPQAATTDEVKAYANVLRPLSPGQVSANEKLEGNIINGVVDEIYMKYGPTYGPQVLFDVLKHVTMKKETAEVVSEAIDRAQKGVMGPYLTRDGQRRIDSENQRLQIEQSTQLGIARDRVARQEQIDALDQRGRNTPAAVTPGRIGANVQDPQANAPAPAAPAAADAAPAPAAAGSGPAVTARQPTKAAIEMLRKDPDRLMPKFIEAYGEAAVPSADLASYKFRQKQRADTAAYEKSRTK